MDVKYGESFVLTRPFVGLWARADPGRAKRETAERVQRPAPQNLRNSRLVICQEGRASIRCSPGIS